MRPKGHGLRNKLACGGVCGSSDIRRTAASEMEHSGIELGMAGPRVDDQLKSELARRGLFGFSDIRRTAASEMEHSGIELGMAGPRVDDQLKSELARRGLFGFSDIRRTAASEMTRRGIEPGMAGPRVAAPTRRRHFPPNPHFSFRFALPLLSHFVYNRKNGDPIPTKMISAMLHAEWRKHAKENRHQQSYDHRLRPDHHRPGL